MFKYAAYFLTSASIVSAQSWFTDVGYDALIAQEGVSTPDGGGITVGVVEASTSAGSYTANTASSQFTGKTLTDVTGTSGGTSSHATTVATRFFGNTGSIASGITTANFYNADDYIDDLNTSNLAQPTAYSEKIMNHSYYSDGFSTGAPDYTPLTALNSEALKRFDYSLVRDNTLAVIGLNNGSSTTVPTLLAHNYNGITVGRTDGAHSTGQTTTEGTGRVKPDLVAPGSYTSYATPMVSASAAVLLSSTHSTTNYEKITSQKAVLLAGATKEGEAFETSWSRSDSQPLDSHYGAGEVNVLNSFNILAAGEQSSGLTDTTGWDLANITEGSSNSYTFTIAPAFILTELSAALTWNREVDNTLFTSATVSDLRLELTDSSGSLIQLSDSAVDNVEHIYLNPGIAGAALTEGTYTLSVMSTDGNSGYSLAWRSEIIAIPEPNSVILLMLGSFGFLARRCR